MKLKFGFYAMIMALCAVTFSACDSDEPGGNTDPETPETPVEPAEPLTDEIRPVLTEGKKWIRNQTWKDRVSTHTYSVYGDTTYNGLTAKKIKREYINQYNYPSIDVQVQREENSTVYRLCEVDEQNYEYVYDFRYIYNIQPDEACTIEDSNGLQSITLVSKGTIVLQGKTRRATLIKAKRTYHETLYDIWVEGVGPLFGIECWNHFIYAPADVYDWNPMFSMLMECFDGEEKIYDYTEFSYNRYKPETMFIETESDETIKDTFKTMIKLATE